MIRDCTRIRKQSFTLLDHIYVSDKEKVVQSGVLNLALGDHCARAVLTFKFCTRKLSTGQINTHSTVKLRSMKSYDVSEFQTKLN